MLHDVGSVVFWTLLPFSPLFCEAATLGREEGKNFFFFFLPVLSSGFLLGKRGLKGRGMASTREEVISLPWGNLLQTAKSHYNTLATETRAKILGGKPER